MRIALLLLFLAAPAYGQVVELSAGQSTEYNAAGAGATFHLASSTAYVGMGMAGGHFQLGFSDSRQFHGWDVTVGDKFFSSSIGLGVTERGVAIGRRTKRSTVALFVGSTGPGSSTPFFAATTAQHFGAGVFYRLDITHSLQFDSVEAFAGPQTTVVESLDYKWRTLHAAGAVGVLQNEKYWNIAAEYQVVHRLGINVARTTYAAVTVNSVGTAVQLGHVTFHGSAFESGPVTGEAVGAALRLGFLTVQADRYLSKFGTNTTVSTGEHIGRHWQLQEFVSESAGRLSFSAGGGYTGNAFAVSLGQSVYFQPLATGNPFQRSLNVTVSLRLPHDSSASVSTSVDPTGHLRYSVYGSSFAGLPASEQTPASRVKGSLEIRGMVLDSRGTPLVGAAVRVGSQLVYSDSSGAFFAREKTDKPQPLTVDVEQFSAPGRWAVVDCPAFGKPADLLQIKVKRD